MSLYLHTCIHKIIFHQFIYIYAHVILRTCLSHKYCFHCQLGCQEAYSGNPLPYSQGLRKEPLVQPEAAQPQWIPMKHVISMGDERYWDKPPTWPTVSMHALAYMKHLGISAYLAQMCTPARIKASYKRIGLGRRPWHVLCNLGPFSYGYSHGDHSPHKFGYGAPHNHGILDVFGRRRGGMKCRHTMPMPVTRQFNGHASSSSHVPIDALPIWSQNVAQVQNSLGLPASFQEPGAT